MNILRTAVDSCTKKVSKTGKVNETTRVQKQVPFSDPLQFWGRPQQLPGGLSAVCQLGCSCQGHPSPSSQQSALRGLRFSRLPQVSLRGTRAPACPLRRQSAVARAVSGWLSQLCRAGHSHTGLPHHRRWKRKACRTASPLVLWPAMSHVVSRQPRESTRSRQVRMRRTTASRKAPLSRGTPVISSSFFSCPSTTSFSFFSSSTAAATTASAGAVSSCIASMACWLHRQVCKIKQHKQLTLPLFRGIVAPWLS